MKKLGSIISIVALLVGLGVGPASALTFTPLTLVNGWVGGCFNTTKPAVSVSNGVVYLKGAMCSGTATLAFTLPVGFRPAHIRYISVDMCSATYGRIYIQPDGTTNVQAETNFSNAQCLTSLDGVSFAQ